MGFQCKAFLKKILLDFLRNSGGFHQANPDLNPGGFPVEFHWDSGRIPLGFQWNSSGIPVEILLGFRWKMLGFRWNFRRDSAFFFSWEGFPGAHQGTALDLLGGLQRPQLQYALTNCLCFIYGTNTFLACDP